MTIEEMYTLPADESGWRLLPNGNRVKLGDGVKIGDNVILGDYVILGNNVSLGNRVKLGDYVKLRDDVSIWDRVVIGNYVTLGNRAKLGDDVILGNRVKLGDDAKIGYGVKIGDGVAIGNRVTLWDYVTLGEGVKLGDDGLHFDITPLQIQGSKHLVYVAGPNIIGVGCMRGTYAWWKENYKRVGLNHGYTESQIEEYADWIEIAHDCQNKCLNYRGKTMTIEELCEGGEV